MTDFVPDTAPIEVSTGNIVVGGRYNSYAPGGIPGSGIALMDPTGALIRYLGTNWGDVYSLRALSNDTFVVHGYLPDVRSRAVLKVTSTGNIDSGFEPFLLADQGNATTEVVPGVAGEVFLIGGAFIREDIVRNGVAKLRMDGTLDADYNDGNGPNDVVAAGEVQKDGMLVIGGDFSSVNGIPRTFLARYTVEGKVDPNFIPPPLNNLSLTIRDLAIQSDGKIVVVGSACQICGGVIARLLPNGQWDDSFPRSVFDRGSAGRLILDQDDSVFVLGDFNFVERVPISKIARFSKDGQLDVSYLSASTMQPGYSLEGTLQRDGKLLLFGVGQAMDNSRRSNLARLHGKGGNTRIRADFNPAAGMILTLQDFDPTRGRIQSSVDLTNWHNKDLQRLNATSFLDPDSVLQMRLFYRTETQNDYPLRNLHSGAERQ